MTVAEETFPVTRTGNGATTVFPYSFTILTKESAVVELVHIENGTRETLSESEFTISGLGTSSGSITYPLSGSPISSEYQLVIGRDTPTTQTTSTSNQTAYFPEVAERVWDKLTMICQELQEKFSRAFKAPPGGSGGYVYPGDDNYLAVWEDGNLVQGPNASSFGPPTGSIYTQVDRFSGDGTTVDFTLSYNPLGEENTAVYINGVYQQKDTYSVAAQVLTFSEAPPIGSDNVEVVIHQNVPGVPNPDAYGVPVGGTTGQVLQKASDDDLDTEWADAGTGGSATFIGLSDAPDEFTGAGYYHVQVSADETELIFVKRSFATRDDLVTHLNSYASLADQPYTPGDVVTAGRFAYERRWVKEGTRFLIEDMEGWAPFGDYHVEHFGVVGDDDDAATKTLNTTRMQSMLDIDPVHLGGLFIHNFYLTGGMTYFFDGGLTVPNRNIGLAGKGPRNAVLEFDADVTDHLLVFAPENSTTLSRSTYRGNNGLSNVKIEGNQGSVYARRGLILDKQENFNLENVTLSGCNWGLQVRGSQDVFIKNIRSTGNNTSSVADPTGTLTASSGVSSITVTDIDGFLDPDGNEEILRGQTFTVATLSKTYTVDTDVDVVSGSATITFTPPLEGAVTAQAVTFQGNALTAAFETDGSLSSDGDQEPYTIDVVDPHFGGGGSGTDATTALQYGFLFKAGDGMTFTGGYASRCGTAHVSINPSVLATGVFNLKFFGTFCDGTIFGDIQTPRALYMPKNTSGRTSGVAFINCNLGTLSERVFDIGYDADGNPVNTGLSRLELCHTRLQASNSTGGAGSLGRINGGNKAGAQITRLNFTGGEFGEASEGMEVSNCQALALSNILFREVQDGSGTAVPMTISETSAGRLDAKQYSLSFSDCDTNSIVDTTEIGTGFLENQYEWYEEGSWTPELNFTGTTDVTYAYRSGTYIRVGNQVTINFQLKLSSLGTSSGNNNISGVPDFDGREKVAPPGIGSLVLEDVAAGYLQGRQVAIRMRNTGLLEVLHSYLAGGGKDSMTLFDESTFTDTTFIQGTITYHMALS